MQSLKIGFFTLCVLLYTLDETEAAAPTYTGGGAATVNEDVSNGATVYTLTADQASFGTLGGTDAALFGVAPNAVGSAGTSIVITITTSPDYSVKSSYSFTIVLENAGGETSTTDTLTLTVVPTPVFAPYCVPDGSGAGTVVFTPENIVSGSGLTLTWTINAGNTGTMFAIASGTGQVSVASGKTVSAATESLYSLTLRAVDSGTTAQTGDVVVNVYVGSSCPSSSGATMAMASLLSLGLFMALKNLI